MQLSKATGKESEAESDLVERSSVSGVNDVDIRAERILLLLPQKNATAKGRAAQDCRRRATDEDEQLADVRTAYAIRIPL